MNYRFLSAVILSTVCTLSYSSPISPSEALTRALQAKEFKKKGATPGNMRLIHSEMDPASDACCFYIFNNDNGGYMIVTADDRLPAVIGYSDNGKYDINNIPPAMKWWLDGYREQISIYLNDETLQPPKYSTPNDSRTSISPLLTTKWDQDAPYWNYTPLIGGKHCYSGCVATAMAQVMNYHQWPERGTGENSYFWGLGGKTLSADFSDYEFGWDMMLDSYSGSSTPEEDDAVASLMYACGISVNMSYSTIGSGAASQRIPPALMNNFSYARGTRFVARSYYSEAEWIQLIYDELKAGRPVLYGGNGSAGGHQFVCDGYSADTNRFHFNWGWSGESDGYFMVNALNPPYLGAGGGAGGFNSSQDVVIGVQKPTEDNEYVPVIVARGGFTTNYPYDPTTWGFKNGYFYTTDFRNYTITPGVRFTSSDGEEIFFFADEPVEMPSANQNTGYTSGPDKFKTSVDASLLELGKQYDVYPVFRYKDKIYPIKIATAFSQYATVFAQEKDYLPLETVNFSYPDVESGEVCDMTFQIRNNTDESLGADISLAIYGNDSQLIELRDNVASVDEIKSGQVATVNFTTSTEGLPENLYYVALRIDDEPNDNKFPWVIGKRIRSLSMPAEIELDDHSQFTIPVTASPDDATWQRYKWVSQDTTVATVNSNGTVIPHEDGTTCITVSATDGSDAVAKCLVKVDFSSGVASIVTEDDTVEIFRIDGRKIASETLSSLDDLLPGIYIVKSDNGKTFKFIK